MPSASKLILGAPSMGGHQDTPLAIITCENYSKLDSYPNMQTLVSAFATWKYFPRGALSRARARLIMSYRN
jgi:hypothetical protein